MTDGGARAALKRALGAMPLAAEAFQVLGVRGKPPATGFALDRLQAALPAWARAVQHAGAQTQLPESRRLLVIGGLSWWIEYAAALSLLLTAAGHRVDLAYTAHRRWMEPTDAFDLRRQQAYLARALRGLGADIRRHDLSRAVVTALPTELEIVAAGARSDRRAVHAAAGGARPRPRRRRSTSARAPLEP